MNEQGPGSDAGVRGRRGDNGQTACGMGLAVAAKPPTHPTPSLSARQCSNIAKIADIALTADHFRYVGRVCGAACAESGSGASRVAPRRRQERRHAATAAAGCRERDSDGWLTQKAKSKGAVRHAISSARTPAHYAAARPPPPPPPRAPDSYYAGWADKIHGKTIPCDSKFGKVGGCCACQVLPTTTTSKPLRRSCKQPRPRVRRCRPARAGDAQPPLLLSNTCSCLPTPWSNRLASWGRSSRGCVGGRAHAAPRTTCLLLCRVLPRRACCAGQAVLRCDASHAHTRKLAGLHRPRVHMLVSHLPASISSHCLPPPELPSAYAGLEGGPSAGGRQLRRAQACRAGGGLAAGRAQRGATVTGRLG